MDRKVAQYDATPESMRLAAERSKLRMALREEYLKKLTNPYNRDGHVFDPAMQRYFSMHATITDRFVPTWKTFGLFMGFYILPVALYTWFLYDRYMKFDKKCRTGQIKYEDRWFKFQ